jgi:hypothetical protein
MLNILSQRYDENAGTPASSNHKGQVFFTFSKKVILLNGVEKKKFGEDRY